METSDSDIEAGFQVVQERLERLKTLLAWQQLGQAEARPHPTPGFTIQASGRQDLRNEYTLFLAEARNLHDRLDRPQTPALSESKRRLLRQRLIDLEDQAEALGITESFINP